MVLLAAGDLAVEVGEGKDESAVGDFGRGMGMSLPMDMRERPAAAQSRFPTGKQLASWTDGVPT